MGRKDSSYPTIVVVVVVVSTSTVATATIVIVPASGISSIMSATAVISSSAATTTLAPALVFGMAERRKNGRQIEKEQETSHIAFDGWISSIFSLFLGSNYFEAELCLLGGRNAIVVRRPDKHKHIVIRIEQSIKQSDGSVPNRRKIYVHKKKE